MEAALRVQAKDVDQDGRITEEVTLADVERQFSCDLVSQSRLHVLFLRTLHTCGVSSSRPSIESFRRYSTLWLPLLDQAKKQTGRNPLTDHNEGLIPPPDIAWVWHCHRLAPFRYAQHVRDRFHAAEPFEADPPFALQHSDTRHDSQWCAAVNTRELWKQLYPNEPFFLEEDKDPGTEEPENGGFLSGFNVLESAERQSTFLWQVSGPCFNDMEFLQQGVLNYYRFLRLKSTDQGKKQIIVPTYQIDLMWHTHMLSSIKEYNDDCLSIMGQTLNHDDSLVDRSENSDLNIAFGKTKELWKTMYGMEFTVPGGMYRGEPPESYFDASVWKKVIQDAPTGPYLHLRGKVGASSTGTPEASAPFRGASEWTPLDASQCPDGKPPFVEAEARSKTVGVVSNPEKEDYIFGKGPNGFGYYHTTTRESYQILLIRINKRVQSKQSEYGCHSCLACICPCFSQPLERKQECLVQLNDLKDLQGLVRARSEADVPIGMVGVPEDLTQPPPNEENARRRDAFNRDNYYTHGGIWLFPMDLRDAGGGCGAILDGGGGCGASGCAAGGCGGGACGAGGCGGGGCGGCGG